MASDRPDDLHWDAFRYVSGALTAPESALFEERLDHDQGAREAVAAAVALVSVLARIDDPRTIPISPPVRHVPRRLLTWAASGVAASLLAVVASHFLAPRHDAATGVTPARAVALTWSNLLRDEDPPAERLALLDDVPGASEFESDDRALPGWLVAAAVLHDSVPTAASARREN